MQKLEFKRQTVELDKPAGALIGHAVGILMAGEIQCMLVSSSSEKCAELFKQFSGHHPDMQFSTPVAVIQQRDLKK